MTKWTYEQIEAVMTLIWEGYMRDEYPLEDTERMVTSALQVAEWGVAEFNEETILRSADEPGCRLANERGTN